MIGFIIIKITKFDSLPQVKQIKMGPYVNDFKINQDKDNVV